MATVSIRDTAQHCLGVTGTISVYRDVFGYVFPGVDRELRVRRHIQRIKGRSINLCMVLVGYDGFDSVWTEDRTRWITHAIDLMREIYAQADLGVRKITWYQITPPESVPFEVVDRSQATDLTEAYSCDADGIDVFWVRRVTDAGGWSNSDGPCDKDEKGRTGVVLELLGGNSADGKGVLLSHEVGHYLTLEHANSIANMMGHDNDGDGIGSINADSRDITNAQRDQMHESCWVRGTC